MEVTAVRIDICIFRTKLHLNRHTPGFSEYLQPLQYRVTLSLPYKRLEIVRRSLPPLEREMLTIILAAATRGGMIRFPCRTPIRSTKRLHQFTLELR